MQSPALDTVSDEWEENDIFVERGSSLDVSMQDLEHRLTQALDDLPTGGRKVFEPFRFNSEQYSQEVVISAMIRGYSNTRTSDLDRSRRFLRAVEFYGRGTHQLNTDTLSELMRVRDAQKKWIDTQSVFRIQRRFIQPSTFNRCQDMVRQILLHLSLYARALTEDNPARRADGMFQMKMLGSHFQRPGGQKLHRPGQPSFRNGLISYYDCLRGKTEIWCPVLGQWAPRTECTAAHIVPYSFPPHVLRSMTHSENPETMVDDPTEPSMVPENGLYLYTPIEKALDTGKLVIVPRMDSGGHVDFKVHLLDESLQTNATFKFHGRHHPWRALEGKSLDFRNQNRPAKNFLYLHILLTVLRKCIYQPPNWAYRLTEFIDIKESVVLTPRPHLIDSTFMRLSKLITDVAVFKQVNATIPMAPTILPSTNSEHEIEEITDEYDVTVAELFAILQDDSDSGDVEEQEEPKEQVQQEEQEEQEE
jgi:hypothetical protein